MRSWAFQIGIVLLLGAIAAALFLHAANGRYQLVREDNNEIVIDTRTGEYWDCCTGGFDHVDVKRGTVETGPLKITERTQPIPAAASAASSAPASH